MPLKFEKLKIETASKDIGSGVVVFLVALPLCMGIALASGAPVLSGLIAGVIGGTVVAFFSGSELSVSGPAAGLAAVVSAGIATLGSFELFLVGLVIAGVLQVALGLLRAGAIAHFIPNGVIRGMLAAIGVVIILKQIPHLIGWDGSAEIDESVVGLPATDPFSWISHLDARVEIGALVIGLTCLTFLIMWEMPVLKRMTWTKLIPGALLAVVIGTTLNEYLLLIGSSLAIPHGTTHLVQIPLVSQGAELFRFPDFGEVLLSGKVWILAVTLALVGSLETLLCIEATDKLDPEQRISNTNRELLAQGIGNTLSGLVGGLPVTSVIVRSSTNIYAGARTRISSIVHGLLLASAILLIPDFLNRIPLATLAAVLIMVGYKLTSVQVIRESWANGLSQFIPFGITIIAVVATDLLIGIVLGTASALFWVFRANRFACISVVHTDTDWLVRFNKDASFVNKSKLKEVFRKIPNNTHVVIDATKASVVDNDIYETIGEFAQAATFRCVEIEFVNVFGKQR